MPRLEPKWSEYSLDRTGERHARTRDASYDQLLAARDQLGTDVKAAALENTNLAANLDSVFRKLKELALPGASGEAVLAGHCEAAGAVLLREAIYELTEDLRTNREEEPREERACLSQRVGR